MAENAPQAQQVSNFKPGAIDRKPLYKLLKVLPSKKCLSDSFLNVNARFIVHSIFISSDESQTNILA